MRGRSLAARLHGLRFAAVENPDGVAGEATVFEYRLEGAAVTGHYRGGAILHGQLVGRVTADDGIELLYHCLTSRGELLAGRSRGRLSLDARDRMHIEFEWAWLAAEDHGGRSHHVELDPARGPGRRGRPGT